MTEKFPKFAVVGARPVKIVQTPDGGLDVLAWDWEKKELVRNFDYLTRVLVGDDETTYLGERDFERHCEALRKRKEA